MAPHLHGSTVTNFYGDSLQPKAPNFAEGFKFKQVFGINQIMNTTHGVQSIGCNYREVVLELRVVRDTINHSTASA